MSCVLCRRLKPALKSSMDKTMVTKIKNLTPKHITKLYVRVTQKGRHHRPFNVTRTPHTGWDIALLKFKRFQFFVKLVSTFSDFNRQGIKEFNALKEESRFREFEFDLRKLQKGILVSG